MENGRVFSIEEFSIHDGPGIRMTVFLKGCPLRCNWCHSPEGVEYNKQIIKSANGCVNCGSCLRKSFEVYGKSELTDVSIGVCPYNLLRQCGQDYSSNQLINVISENSDFLKNGGVTFSGGEPLMQYRFLFECLDGLKGKVHTAIQTSGFADEEVFDTALCKVDYVLYDLKIIDERLSVKYTGQSSSIIKRNFNKLAKSGREFVVRTPLIPTITDTVNNLRDIADLLKENKVKYVEFLPYHKLTGSKYKTVQKEYSPMFDENVPVDLESVKQIFNNNGINYKVL